MCGEALMGIETDEETSHYLHSILRERIVEHVFVGDALRLLWQHRVTERLGEDFFLDMPSHRTHRQKRPKQVAE
jgi:hypothetical protein